MSYQEHTLAATTVTDGSADLPIISGTLTVDEGWAPYIQGTIVCPMLTAAQLAPLDPRQPYRAIYIQASAIDYSNTIPNSALSATLMLRSRVIDRTAQTVTLTLASDEAMTQDYRLMETAGWRPPTSDLRALVNLVLERVGITYRLSMFSTDPTDTIDPDKTIWMPGVSAWDYLIPLVQKAGLRLWANESRRWSLARVSNDLSGTVTLRTDQTVTAIEETIDRDADEWFDAVVVRYSWTDAAGTAQTAADTAANANFSRVLLIDHDTYYPGPGAAAAILARSLSRGNLVTTAAVSNYNARPGMGFTLAGPGLVTVTGVLSAVSWDFPGNEMAITSRGLLDLTDFSWAALPAGIAWSASPAGGTWANETI